MAPHWFEPLSRIVDKLFRQVHVRCQTAGTWLLFSFNALSAYTNTDVGVKKKDLPVTDLV